MTVRVQWQDREKPSRRRLRVAEYLLLIAGLMAIDVYIWVDTDTAVSQAYDSWSLDQMLAGRQPSLRGYLASLPGLSWIGSGENPASTPSAGTPQERNATESSPAEMRRHRLPEFAMLGRVEVPRLGLEAVVREGVNASTLRTAVGHMPSTPLPGELGNSALAAHRDTLFRKLRGIRKNDRITFQGMDGTYTYVVESTSVVKPEDVGVLKSAKGDRMLTLITCYPFNYIGAAPNRFIVKARQLDVTAREQPQSRTKSAALRST